MNDNKPSDLHVAVEESGTGDKLETQPSHSVSQASPVPPETIYEPSNRRSKTIFIVVGLVVLLLDQLSKWYVEQTVPLNGSLAPIESLYPYFQFSHVANTGVSFGLFSGINAPMIIVASVAAVAVFYYAWRSPPESRWFYFALGLVFGGIVGNLIDRVRLGHVTDFVNINLRPLLNIPFADWYIFNIADLSLISGVIVLFALSFREARQARKVENSKAPGGSEPPGA